MTALFFFKIFHSRNARGFEKIYQELTGSLPELRKHPVFAVGPRTPNAFLGGDAPRVLPKFAGLIALTLNLSVLGRQSFSCHKPVA